MGPIISALASALSGVAASIIGLILNGWGIITGAFLWLCVNILNWVLSPNFISLSYTDPSRNEFLKVGWNLTKDFGNIIIVLALVVIGLGTALRLAGYQAQKALPTLILIALLINFTPVFCGLIVDAANILMTFFVGDSGFSGGNSFINLFNNQWGNIERMAGGGKLWDPTASGEAIAAAVGAIALIFFNIIAGVIYLLFALVFMVRYVAIWVLVILSPIAFACYILPDTRKVFTQWWQQFLQWSFIGVIGSFFLYLADHFLMATQSPKFHAAESTLTEVGSAPGLSSIINNIMPFAVVIVFLIMGLMLTLSSSAAGASGVMNFAKKNASKAGEWMGKKSLAFARDKMPEGVRRWAERQSAAKKLGEGEKGFTGWLKRTASTPFTGIQRGMGGLVTGSLNEKLDTEKNYENAKKQNAASNLRDYRKSTSEAEKAGIMRAMVEKGQLKDALDTSKFGKSALTEGELLKTYEKAVKMGDEDTFEGIERGLAGKTITSSFAEIRSKADSKLDKNGLSDEDRKQGYRNYNDKIIAKADTPEKMKQLRKGWQDDHESLQAANLFWGGNQVHQATMLHGRSFSDKFVKSVQEHGVDWYFEMNPNTKRARNPDLVRYLSSPGAMSMGIGLTDTNQNEIKQKAVAANVIEQHPELEDYYKNYSDIRKMEKDVKVAQRKGASQGDLQTAKDKAKNAREILDDSLNILYGIKPDSEKAWDGLMEKLEPKQRRQGRNP